VASKASDVATGAVRSLKAVPKNVPAAVESNLVDTLGDIAEKNGLERPTATTAREATSQLADQYKSRAQSVYQQLDDDAPGFQELRDQIAKHQKAVGFRKTLTRPRPTRCAVNWIP
jgi:hypothetical protein